MPIYEYYCDACDKNFECLILGNEKPECPLCNSKKVKKLISSCSFFSKGSHGQTVKSAASQPSCSGCTATSCKTCGQ